MKLSIIITTLFFSIQVVGQNSEDFIPRDAVTVFSINNISLLQKISMDDLVQYEFMEEVQTELFDGSTSGKTLKDSGIDFEQKLNVFYGKGTDHEVSGFTFGIKNKAQLFTVFDDFDKIEWAIEQQLDYISFCSVFPSSSVNTCDLVSKEVMIKARAATQMPIFLSGGINTHNMEQLSDTGFNGIAVVSGIMAADDTAQASLDYKHALNKLNR